MDAVLLPQAVSTARVTAPRGADEGRGSMQDLLGRFTAAHEVLGLLGRSPRLPALPPVRTDLVRHIAQGEALADDVVAALRRTGVRSVGELDTASLIRTLERTFGLDVAKTDLPHGLDGAAWQSDGFRLILLGRTPHWTRQRFTLAHELGHLLADDAHQLLAESHLSPGRQKDAAEVRANVFAANFLMPRGEIGAAVPERGPSDEEFRLLVVRFMVSPSALAARLGQLGLLRTEKKVQLRRLTTEACYWLTGRIDDFEAHSVWAQTPRLPLRPARGLYECYLAGDTTLRPLAAYAGVDSEQLYAALTPSPDDPVGRSGHSGHSAEDDPVFQP